ncbi:hypothetical protein AAHH72_05470 [Bacillus cereus]
MQIEKAERILMEYEEIISSMKDTLDEMKYKQGTVYTQDEVEGIEVEFEQIKNEYEQHSQLFNSTVMPPLRYGYEVIKNSLKK